MPHLKCLLVTISLVAGIAIGAPAAQAEPSPSQVAVASPTAGPCTGVVSIKLRTAGLARMVVPQAAGKSAPAGRVLVAQLKRNLMSGVTPKELCDTTPSPEATNILDEARSALQSGEEEMALLLVQDYVDGLTPRVVPNARTTTPRAARTGSCPGIDSTRRTVPPQRAKDAFTVAEFAATADALGGDPAMWEPISANAMEVIAASITDYVTSGAGGAASVGDWTSALALAQLWNASDEAAMLAHEKFMQSARDAVDQLKKSRCAKSKHGANCLGRAAIVLAMVVGDQPAANRVAAEAVANGEEASKVTKVSPDCIIEKYSYTVDWDNPYTKSSGTSDEIQFELYDRTFTIVNAPRLLTDSELVVSCSAEGAATDYGTWHGDVFDISSVAASRVHPSGMRLAFSIDPSVSKTFYHVTWTRNGPYGLTCLGATMSEEDIGREADINGAMDALLLPLGPIFPRRQNTRLSSAEGMLNYGPDSPITYNVTFLGTQE